MLFTLTGYLGVPPASILSDRYLISGDTLQTSLLLAPILSRLELRRVILVTSHSHAARATQFLDSALEMEVNSQHPLAGQGKIKLAVVAATDEGDNFPADRRKQREELLQV